MTVEIEDQHFLTLGSKMSSRNRHIVENAKPAAMLWIGMMTRRTNESKTAGFYR